MTDRDFASRASELETTKLQLMLASDTTGLASILSDELYYVHSNGIEDNKRAISKKLGTKRATVQRRQARLRTYLPVVVTGTNFYGARFY